MLDWAKTRGLAGPSRKSSATPQPRRNDMRIVGAFGLGFGSRQGHPATRNGRQTERGRQFGDLTRSAHRIALDGEEQRTAFSWRTMAAASAATRPASIRCNSPGGVAAMTLRHAFLPAASRKAGGASSPRSPEGIKSAAACTSP